MSREPPVPEIERPEERKRAAMQHLARFPFRAPWWLWGRHAQTVYGPLVRRPKRAALRAESWPTPDGDTLGVHTSEHAPEQPTLLILHGLEGSVESHYVQGLAARFDRAGWNVVAFEHRSCGGAMNTARRLYHSGETSDLSFVVDTILERWPATRLFVAGVSLGGNLIARWLGECGARAPERVVAAAAVSPPFDLKVSGPSLDRALGGLYARQFLRTLIPKMIAKERQYPGCVDIDAVRRSKSFAEFDTHATAALHGFRDAQDYWAKVSCGPLLPRVRRPILLIAAADDPFNPSSSHPHEVAARSPFVHPLFTKRGGHVGFVCGSSPFRARYWAEEQIERFFTFYRERDRSE